MTDIIAAANILVGNDPEEVLEFCRIITEVESEILAEMAEKRKRDIDKLSRNKGKR